MRCLEENSHGGWLCPNIDDARKVTRGDNWGESYGSTRLRHGRGDLSAARGLAEGDF